jgi:hypothetical protein
MVLWLYILPALILVADIVVRIIKDPRSFRADRFFSGIIACFVPFFNIFPAALIVLDFIHDSLEKLLHNKI